MYAQLHDVHEGKCPPDIDHTRHEHPYKNLWKDQWEEKLSASATLSPYTSINKLITHMFTKTEKAFAGSKHEKTWLIYHDALKLMTGKEAIEFMKQKNGMVVSFVRNLASTKEQYTLIELLAADPNCKC